MYHHGFSVTYRYVTTANKMSNVFVRVIKRLSPMKLLVIYFVALFPFLNNLHIYEYLEKRSNR